MGFFSSLFKKRRVPVEEKVDIHKKIESLQSTPKQFVKMFDEIKDRTTKALKELEGAEFKEEIDSRLRKMIDGSRKAFVTKMRGHIEKVESSQRLDEFRDELKRFLERSNKEMVRYADRVALGFDRELRTFSSRMAKFNDVSERTEGLIKRNDDELNSLLSEVENKRTLDRLKGERERIKAGLERTLKVIMVKKRQLQSTNEEMKTLESGNKASKQATLKRELEKLKAERNGVVGVIRLFKTGVEKGLRDYMRGIETTAMHSAIKDFLESPESLREVELLTVAVSDMISIVKKGDIHLTSKRRKKLMKAADMDIKQLFKSLAKVEDEISAKEGVLKVLGFSSVRAELKGRASNLTSDIRELESSVKSLEKRKSDARKAELKLIKETQKE